jgi:hypothetical protein
MRIRRSLPIIVALLLVAAAVALVVVLRKQAPPEPARLLPGADGFVYLNLQWMRRANLLGELPVVPHDPDYERFIQATGFQFERDLEEAAFAIHYPPKAMQQAPPRFSDVFVGKIHAERLRAYLKSISSSSENYRAVEVYSIPLEGRIVRIAVLGPDTVAASNIDDPQVIRGILDRSRKLASPFAGPALLRQYYRHVPLASLGWAIFRIDPSAELFKSAPGGWSTWFTQPAVVLASIRYLRELHFRGVAFSGSEQDAKNVADRATSYLNLFHAAEISTGTQAPDPDVKALFDSLKVEQDKDRTVLTATVPVGFVRKALAEAPLAVTPEAAPRPETTPVPPPPSTRKQVHKKQGSR